MSERSAPRERWASSLAQLAWLSRLVVLAPRQSRFPFRDPATIERAQRRRVRAAVQHAYRHVPFYRTAIDRLGLSPASFEHAADLARLPLIDRHDLQQNLAELTSRDRPLSGFVKWQTGGTTGAPVTVYVDRMALIEVAAFHQRTAAVRRALVQARRPRRILKIAHEPDPSERDVTDVLALARRLVGRRTERVSILDPIERNVDAINRFRPDVLSSFGSYLEGLFVYLHRSGREFHRPRLVTYGSDAMSPAARALITDTFGIPVLSGYGAYEAPGLGFECEAHRGFHINVDLYPLRIVDRTGREVPHGEHGEVVVSNLVCRGTMLLNYRLGDLAAWLPGPCPCGRNLPVLTFVQGRVADWLTLPSGQRLHPQTVTVVLEVDPDILRYQVIQTEPQVLDVKLVLRPACDGPAVKRRVQEGFARLFGPEVVTCVHAVEDLTRTGRGKVRLVVGLEGSGTPAPG